MGGKGSKNNNKPGDAKIVPKKNELTPSDLDKLAKQTGLSQQDIKDWFTKFSSNNPDMLMDRVKSIFLIILKFSEVFFCILRMNSPSFIEI